MQFSNFSKRIEGNTTYFVTSSPLLNIKDIKYYKDNATGGFAKKEFRWSFNGDYWSAWTDLSQGSISSFKIGNNTRLFLEIRYISSGAGKVSSFTVYYEGAAQNVAPPAPTSSSTIVTKPAPAQKPGEYSVFARNKQGNIIIFSTPNPLVNVADLKYYKDNAAGGFVKREFRWSFNKSYWSSWTPLNQGSLSSVKTENNTLLFLEFRYTLGATGDVTSLTVYYTQAEKSVSIQTDVYPQDSSYNKTSKSYPVDIYDCTTECHIEKSILVDANTLCGKSCDYYLWRPNQKGEQPISTITNLQEVLDDFSHALQNVDIEKASNVGGPGIGVYYNLENKTIYFKSLVQGNKMLLSEDAAGHITIDMDDASINELFQFVGQFDGVNIGGGTGELFAGRDGEDFNIRTLVSGNANVKIETVGDQVLISLDASASGESLWTQVIPVSANLGGITGSGQGGNYAPLGSNSIEILENILYEYFPPRILDFEPSSLYLEKWQGTQDVSVFGNFDNLAFQKVRVYEARVLINGTEFISNYPRIYYSDVSSGSFEWNILGPGDYEDRNYLVKLYHKVNGTLISQPAEASGNIYYVNPYYFGTIGNIDINDITTSDILALDKKIVPKQNNSIDFDVSANFVKLKFVYAYPEEYGTLKSIFDVKNDFNVTTSFDTSTIIFNPGELGSNPFPVSYRIYVKNHWISFTQDVSVFKLNFNI